MCRYLSVIFTSLFVIMISTGCGTKKLSSYEEFVEYAKVSRKSIRLPVVIVPGIKGSILKKGDREYWGKSYRVAWIDTFDELQFPISGQLDQNFSSSFGEFYRRKGVHQGGVMEKYRIALPFLNIWDVSIYKNLRTVLEDSGGYVFNRDLFMFPYDWRLDNRISAAQLACRVRQFQKAYMQYVRTTIFADNDSKYNEFLKKCREKGLLTRGTQQGDETIKVNLITHSMGGLLSRYYIQMLGGEESVHKLIMLGTPNQGSMDALKAIAEGEFPESILHFYYRENTRATIFSWPSTYQLLPRYEHCLKKKGTADRVALDAWGLGAGAFGSPGGSGENTVVANWVKYQMIPGGGHYETVAPGTVNQFLKEQLLSAAKFHDAINGNFDPLYEKEKLEAIGSFCATAKIDVKIEENFIKGHAQTPFIIFGGHCRPTLKYACLSKTENRGDYLEFAQPGKDKEQDRFYTMGDGRVPIVSLRLPKREKPFDYEFLLCTSHAGIVSNKTFQYNLLRELLWQAACLY